MHAHVRRYTPAPATTPSTPRFLAIPCYTPLRPAHAPPCGPSPSCTSPGFTFRRSSVARAEKSSHEYPGGRPSTYSRFLRHVPCENGFGGAGPAPSDLWAWLRIYTSSCACQSASYYFEQKEGRVRTCSIVVMFNNNSCTAPHISSLSLLL